MQKSKMTVSQGLKDGEHNRAMVDAIREIMGLAPLYVPDNKSNYKEEISWKDIKNPKHMKNCKYTE